MEAQTEFSLLYITAANREEALSISHTLLGEHLIACANIHDHVTSMYRWQGEIEKSQEAVIIAKTRAILLPQIIARVKALHSYQTPCVISAPIVAGNPDFLKWIATETAPLKHD